MQAPLEWEQQFREFELDESVHRAHIALEHDELNTLENDLIERQMEQNRRHARIVRMQQDFASSVEARARTFAGTTTFVISGKQLALCGQDSDKVFIHIMNKLRHDPNGSIANLVMFAAGKPYINDTTLKDNAAKYVISKGRWANLIVSARCV